MGARADQREQSTHAQMCSVQFGTAAAESLGLLQAAERGGGGGGLVFRVFDGFDSGRGDNRPDNGPVVELVVGRLRLAGDIVGSKPLHPIHQPMSEKVAFFNGLLSVIHVILQFVYHTEDSESIRIRCKAVRLTNRCRQRGMASPVPLSRRTSSVPRA